MVVDSDVSGRALVGEGVTIVQGVFDGLCQRVGDEYIIGVVVLADPEIGEVGAFYQRLKV